MGAEAFQPTDDWPLQENYKRYLHERIQTWGKRVAPMLEDPEVPSREIKATFLEWLLTSVERGDRVTAGVVDAVDGYARHYMEGPGPYGRGGGTVESAPGRILCQQQFEGLFAIFEAGKSQVAEDR